MAQGAASTDAIRRYLAATDHAPDRLGNQYAGTLDPALRPRPDKRYPTLVPLPLSAELATSHMPALAAIADRGAERATPETPVDLEAIARLCFFSNGITKRIARGGEAMAFRAAPTTGALYHTELYLVTGDLPGLPAGVYHYGAHDHALRQLRGGDYRAAVIEATGGEAAMAQASAIMVVTSVFWRNAWKYAARAYRHTYWDIGTMLPNTLAVAAAWDLPARLVLGFADGAIANLLGLDLDREAVIALIALGQAEAPPAAPPITPLDLPTEPYSIQEIDYPLIRQTHRATLLASGEDAAAWRLRLPPPRSQPAPRAPLVPLPAVDTADLPTEPIEAVIRRRGSTRRFARESISLEHLSALLDHTIRGVPSDALGEGVPFNQMYLIVNAVDGLAPGTYVYHRASHALEPLRLMSVAETRQLAHFLALEQDLSGDAAVNVYVLADLEPVLAAFGNRGYRLAQLGGALVAGKLYLAAYALGLGATGLTFYDRPVSDAFSPHAAAKRVMFLIAIGVPARS